MPTYVAFLRAINLGKQRRVAMGRLRTVLTDAGYDDVVTHLLSGNIVLGSRARASGPVAKAVEKLLRGEFALDVDAFLKSRPRTAAGRGLGESDFGRDEFRLRGTEIYLRYPNGVAGSKMSTAFFERVLGTPATVRTWRVVSRLQELAG